MEDNIQDPKLKISNLIDTLVKETDSLFNFIIFSNKESLLSNTTSDYILYAIENLLCYTFFPRIF